MPTYKLQFANNALTTLAAGISDASPSLQVVSGGGALFPVLGTNQAFICTLIKSGNPNIYEIVLVTGHAAGSDNFTGLVRNLEGTGALSWNAGDSVAWLPTAAGLRFLSQKIDTQAQLDNYAIDVGSANAYAVNLPLALNGHVVGMPIRWRAGHTNTSSACTFNDGVGTGQLITSQLHGIPIGAIVAGGIYESIWDGTYFELSTVQSVFFENIGDQIQNSQVPFSAIAQWESSLVIAFSQLGGQLLNGQLPASFNLPGSPTTTTQSAGDSSTKVATTAFANPGVTVSGSSVCIRLPSGHKIQLLTANPNGGSQAVTYPVAFTSYAYPVVSGLAGGNVQNWLVNGTQSLTGVTIANTGGSSFLIAIGL